MERVIRNSDGKADGVFGTRRGDLRWRRFLESVSLAPKLERAED
jgi:hypothetical protein